MRGIRCQELSLQGTGHHTYTVYRGQQMSASELDQLKKCVGGTIAMTSFVSTSKTPNVAEMFAGNGEGQTDMESVIFEIIISESEYDYERSPFADISHLSSKEGEDEVLLCLGTVLQVESVEKKEPVTWVRLRMCQREENEVPRQLLVGLNNVKMSFQFVPLGWISLWQLHVVLMFMGCVRQAKQLQEVLLSSIKSMPDTVINPISRFWLECMPLYFEFAELDLADPDLNHRLQMLVSKVQKETRSALDSRPFDNQRDEPFLSPIKLIDDLFHMSKSDQDSVDPSKYCMEFSKKCLASCELNLQPIFDMLWKRILQPMFGMKKLGDQSGGSTMDSISETYHDGTFSENDPQRIVWCYRLAKVAKDRGDYGQAIQLLREGLAIPCTKTYHAVLYQELRLIYSMQEDWFACLDCCRAIIDLPGLPPNSPYIAQAYMDCGRASRELGDYNAALLNYTEALGL